MRYKSNLMTMRLSTLMLTVCYILQSVSTSPDFGLNGNISGSVETAQRSSLAADLMDLLDDYTIPLGSGYQLLYEMRDALYYIARNFVGAGVAMADFLIALADDSTGIVTPPFVNAIQAIAQLKTLLSTRFAEEFSTFESSGASYITSMITDNFSYMLEVTSSLEESLTTMYSTLVDLAQKNGLEDGTPISPSLARHLISPRLVNEVLHAIVNLAAALAPFLYSVHSTLANIDQADTYILTAKSDIGTTLLSAHQEVINFNASLLELKAEATQRIESVAPAYYAQQQDVNGILSQLQLVPTFTKNLHTALTSFNSSLSAVSIAEKVLLLEQTLANYILQAATFDDDLETVYGQRICPALQSVVLVLVSSGPHARYCYAKYSSKVIDLAVDNIFDVTLCHEQELNRLYAVERLIGDIVELVLFNVAELFLNLSVCLESTPCPGSCDSCINTLGTFYVTLSQLTDEKFDLILQIVPYEASASLQRLRSCVAFSKFKLIADAHDLTNTVYDCELRGYY